MAGIFMKDSLNDNQVELCILSDVHIARDKDKRNDYVFDDNGNPLSAEAYMLKAFCNKITEAGNARQLYDGKHMLIFLGDVINGGECGYFNCYTSRAYELLQKTLSPYLPYENILYFTGNHDRQAKFYSTVAKFPHNCVIETIEAQSKKEKLYKKYGIIFEHGNKFDCLCSGKTFLGMMGDFASDIVVNLFSPEVEDMFRGRSAYNEKSPENSIQAVPTTTKVRTMNSECRRVANGALKCLSKEKDCHTIICGHTHQRPVKVSILDGNRVLTYYNTGKFARDGVMNLVLEQTNSGSWYVREDH